MKTRRTLEKGRIDFENVTFSYDGTAGEPVLKNINLTILPGETVGIIGSTGSGKSTLISLIPRFYDVTSGTIKVDGAKYSTYESAKAEGKNRDCSAEKYLVYWKCC